jgi:hypothetical protein
MLNKKQSKKEFMEIHALVPALVAFFVVAVEVAYRQKTPTTLSR